MDSLLKSLNIDLMVLLLNGVVFLVLLFVMNAVFWSPMMKHLEGRRHRISDAYKAVEDTRREMENLRAEYQGRLTAIEAEARGRIQDTVREAQEQRERLVVEARARVEALQREGAAGIQTETSATLADMRGTLDDVALEALTRATGAPTDPAQRRLVEQFAAQAARS
jgi:F-type H+-transporting ATPase subunit b